MDLILVQVNLTKKLTGKKFLIVLGNVWEEYSEEWKEVMKPFNSGARGRHVILLEKNDEIDSLEKKTRYFGCVIELFTNNKTCSLQKQEHKATEMAKKTKNVYQTQFKVEISDSDTDDEA
ncbi:hypothetical protein CsatB_027762 [Cannabis sativa]|uniref:putative disease resistance protein RGA3 n=1 Tax=Cannabis sativa TaxID=3483 RepID=UPI0029CA323D|nr:putative disease resistance protein RGA3 [Cannabis sativa]